MSTISEPVLYDYQDTAVSELRECIRTKQYPVLLYAPCGAGKGTLAAYMVNRAAARGLHVQFWVNRRGLVADLSRRLDALGLDHGVIMSDHPRRKPWLKVHVASIDTLHRRATLPPADLIFIDEAHFSISPTWKSALERYPGVPVIGMTATPVRRDGRGLGEFYKRLVMGPQPGDLIERGFLVSTRVYAPSAPDLKGVKSSGGDYNVQQLGQACDRASLTGDIVQHWLRLGRGRPSVLFAVNRLHAQHCREQFAAAGVRVEYADANTPDKERERLWQRLQDYEVEVACTVDIVSYGWDAPRVSCAIDARPTESLANWLQRIGRIQRKFPGKKDALLLDHAGNTLRHGFAEDFREWSLAGFAKKKKTVDAAPSVRMCKECWAVYSSELDACPYCGAEYRREAKPVEVAPGELQEITERPKYTIRKLSANPEIAKLQQIAAERNYSPGWVFNQARRRGLFGSAGLMGFAS